MAGSGIAKIFKHGRSQAVRLPAEFRLPGKEVRVTRQGNGILLQPVEFDVDKWFAAMDRAVQGRFMEEGRNQPPMPDPEDLFE
jgi:antitoxin VapB